MKKEYKKSLSEIAIEEQIKKLQEENEYHQEEINKNNLLINKLRS